MLNVIIVGGISNFACAQFARSGIELLNFQLALMLLGIGEPFMFARSTILPTLAHTQ